jgi:hypothetical protein
VLAGEKDSRNQVECKPGSGGICGFGEPAIPGNDGTFDAEAEVLDVEIDEEAGGDVCELEVGDETAFVEEGDLVGGKGEDVDEEGAFDDKVEGVGRVDEAAFVGETERKIALEDEFAELEFAGETVAVGGIDEAGAELAVDLHTRSDDDVGEIGLVQVHGMEGAGVQAPTPRSIISRNIKNSIINVFADDLGLEREWGKEMGDAEGYGVLGELGSLGASESRRRRMEEAGTQVLMTIWRFSLVPSFPSL